MEASPDALAEQLRALLQEHGAADLLRALSACARGLAETHPDDEDDWIDAAAATAQAAEALSDDADVEGDDEAPNDGDGDEREQDVEDEDVASTEALATNASTPSAVRPPEPDSTPFTPTDDGAIMRTGSILPPRKDVTHWRARRLSEDRTKSTSLVWGVDGVELSEWPIRELSVDVLRRRWGAGKYLLYWFGPRGDDSGKRMPMGSSRVISLLELPGSASSGNGPEPMDGGHAQSPGLPAFSPPAAPTSASGDLLALAAVRNQGTGGADIGAMLQLLAFMDERQERQRQAQAHEARLAAERYRADLDLQRERERLASQERIAQIEANAKVQGRGGHAQFDPEVLAEAIGRKVQEAMTVNDDGEDEPSAPMALVPQPPSDLATMVNAVKETLAPLLTLLATRLATEPTGAGALPSSYQPAGNGTGHGV